jgi:hypothetical protein
LTESDIELFIKERTTVNNDEMAPKVEQVLSSIKWKDGSGSDAEGDAITFFSDVVIALRRAGVYHALETGTKRIITVLTRKIEPEALRKKVLNELDYTEKSLRNDWGHYVRHVKNAARQHSVHIASRAG